MSPRKGEQTVVPDADFRSYYGQPIIKPPVWKVPDVPAYLYLGGLAGAAATMSALAEATGQRRLARMGTLVAAGGSTASVGFLIHDLGRPLRFLNMLRVLKPTSPLSVGSWIIAPFSTLSGAAAASEITGRFPVPRRISTSLAGVLGPAMMTYTAVLLADTAVPGWHETYRELPFVFAGSAMSSAGGVMMLCNPPRSAAPARRMALAGAVMELAADRRMRQRAGLIGEAFDNGKPGRVLRVSKALTIAGSVTVLAARRSRAAAVAAGLCLSVAAAATRYGVFEAGMESARDPRYTVLPQRARKKNSTAEDSETVG